MTEDVYKYDVLFNFLKTDEDKNKEHTFTRPVIENPKEYVNTQDALYGLSLSEDDKVIL